MARKDLVSGAFWFLISLLVIQQSLSLGLGTFRAPGTGMFPMIWGVALAFLSGMIFFRAFLRARKNANKMRLNVSWSPFGWLGIVIAVLLAFRFAFPHLGFFFCSFVLLVFLFRDPQKKGWLAPLFAAMMTVLVGYIVFHVLLMIQFPRGPWGLM